jgi:TolB-like protein
MCDHSRLSIALALLLTMGVSGVSRADTQSRLAVVELRNSASLREEEVMYLADLVRTQASKALPGDQFLVMTRESIVALLPPGTRLEDCAKSQCEVEVGRTIGADYIVTGEVLRFGDELRLNIKAHACSSGGFVGSEVVKGIKLNDLENGLIEASARLCEPIRRHAGIDAPTQQLNARHKDFEVAGMSAGPVGERSQEMAGRHSAEHVLVSNGEAVVRGDLMWTVRDNGSDVNWFEAQSFCNACRVGGYRDWRMPNIEELEALYVRQNSYVISGVWRNMPPRLKELEGVQWNHEVHVASPFQLSAPTQWSGTFEDEASASQFVFRAGFATAYERTFGSGVRVLCVRQLK